MLSAFGNAFRIPDLRAKLLVVIGLLAVYRLGVFIPTPGVDAQALQGQLQGGVFELLGFISGGNISQFSVFALGVIPYITASIIFQLLTSIYPPLEKLSKEGEEGRRKITQYTRYAALGLGAVQGALLSYGGNRANRGRSALAGVTGRFFG